MSTGSQAPLIYGSENFYDFDTQYLKGPINFLSNSTISVNTLTSYIITDSVLTMSNGYIINLQTSSDPTSAINKEYVDSSSQFNPSGPQGSIQWSSVVAYNGSSNLLWTSDTNTLIASNIDINNTITNEVILNNIVLKPPVIGSYNLVMPTSQGLPGQVLSIIDVVTNISGTFKYLDWVSNSASPALPYSAIQFNLNNTFSASDNLLFSDNILVVTGSASQPGTINPVTTITENIDTASLNIGLFNIKVNTNIVDYTLTLPEDLPDKLSILISDSSGNLSWSTNGLIPSEPINSIQIITAGILTGSSDLTYIPLKLEYQIDSGVIIEGGINQTNVLNPTTISVLTFSDNIKKIISQGAYSYCIDNNGLIIINNFPNTSPSTISTLLFSNTSDIFVTGSNVYITCSDIENKLFIVDINNPSSPSTIGVINNLSSPRSVYINNSLGYISNESGNSVIVDISNVSNPCTISSISYTSATNVFINDNYLYLSNNINITKFTSDINPTSILQISVSSITNIYSNGLYLYLIENNNFKIYTTYSGSLIGSLNGFSGNLKSMYISETLGYLGSTEGLYTINIENSINPTTISFISVSTVYAINAFGNSLYISAGLNYYLVDPNGNSLNCMELGTLETSNIDLFGDLNVGNNLNTLNINSSRTFSTKNLYITNGSYNMINYGTLTTSETVGSIYISNPSIIYPTSNNNIGMYNNNITQNSIIKYSINTFTSGFPYINITSQGPGYCNFMINNIGSDIMYDPVKICYLIM